MKGQDKTTGQRKTAELPWQIRRREAMEQYGITALRVVQMGQKRPYADSDFIWELVTANSDREAVMAFCQAELGRNHQTRAEWQAGKISADVYFHGWHELTATPDGWRYHVYEPYTD